MQNKMNGTDDVSAWFVAPCITSSHSVHVRAVAE